MQAHLHSPQEAAQWLRERAVSALRTDHRKVQAGEGYLAYAGHTVDARRFVDQALLAGARACLIEAQDSDHITEDAHRVASYENLKAHSGKIAAAFYDNPARQLQVLAITGTNGKTSTAWWLAQALNSQGKTDQCALIGTLGIGIPERGSSNLDGLSGSGLTTPDGVLLQHSLRVFVDRGLLFCALEASSIGIEEGRLDGTNPTGQPSDACLTGQDYEQPWSISTMTTERYWPRTWANSRRTSICGRCPCTGRLAYRHAISPAQRMDCIFRYAKVGSAVRYKPASSGATTSLTCWAF
jgi:UDP-N-acetylmuramyl tripeptide synthase